MKRNCWNCKAEYKGKELFCKDCKDKDRTATAPTLVFYDKM